ncbi:TetR/AcrR family transcriptional regulator [Candidatus Aerophobetes bacterium]|uniref:TetR/AcrR family transcriptional regulator n=1 Tax=Aerophobetes bacterium TaxID=2030807 RepID=A0A523S545_UNCAE|nr:MAG: TetR/AcrR family transcriptional regulator [Candidatus Aerophobetes bacterium]
MKSDSIFYKEKGRRDFAAQILQAAEKLFAKKGFYPTTIDEIAKEAKSAKGTIYLYFNNKEDLFFSVIETKLDLLLDKIQEAVEKPGSASQRIKTAISIHLKFLEENKNFFKVMQSLPEGLKKKLERKLKGRVVEKQSRYIEILDRLIQEAIDRKEIKALDSKKLAVILMGIVHSLTVYWISQREKKSLSSDESLAWQVFWEGVSKE